MRRLLFLVMVLVLMSQVVIVQASPNSPVGFECYGQAREFWRYKGPEVILSGPYETGKTMTVLNKFHLLHAKYAGARGLMVRKTYNSLINSAIVTYEKKVLLYPPEDPRSAVTKYGGEKPEFYDYPNGSRIVVGGLDNAAKFLSAEFDYVYVNQAEEVMLNDWELLTGRATGRAGNVPYPQVMGDCNPGPPTHWILSRPRLKLFHSSHRDNPTLFDQATGAITEQGKRTMGTLDALTGVRKKRGRDGKWAGAEGQVYEEWDEGVHLIDRFDIPKEWRRYRAVDFGYSNPFVTQWWATDPDGRLYMYREIYHTQQLVEDHASEILRLEAGKTVEEWQAVTEQYAKDPTRLVSVRQTLAAAGERIEATVADHDAEDRATLHRHGISTRPATKTLSVGIEAFQVRLRVQPDGKPRLFILRDSLVKADPRLAEKRQPLCTHDEVLMYVWPTAADGKPVKEVPVDMYNHGMDAGRYMVMHLDHNTEAAMYVGGRRVG
jgi:phage terminase large subunit